MTWSGWPSALLPATPNLLRLLAENCAVTYAGYTPRTRKLTVRMILQRWRHEPLRNCLLETLRLVVHDPSGISLYHSHLITRKLFVGLIRRGKHPEWVARLLRMHGWADRIGEILTEAGPNAERV